MGIILNKDLMNGGKIYLKRLQDEGYILKSAILVDFDSRKKEGSKKKLVKKIIGGKNADKLINLKNRKNIIKSKNEEKYFTNIISYYEKLDDVFFDNFNIHDYCQEIVEMPLKDFSDEKFINFLSASDIKNYIYLGGKIFRGKVLNMGINFIHSHPGAVPDVRGADCFLWSILYKNKLGYSTFYINDGIDTGDVILKKEFSLPIFKTPSDFSDNDYFKFYKYILNFYDLQKRAEILTEGIKKIVDADYDYIGIQQEEGGRQYYFAQPELIIYGMKKICV